MLPRSASGPLALLLVALCAAAAPAQTTLRLKFQKDQHNAYVMVQEMKMAVQGPMGNNLEMTMKQTVDMSMKVEEVLTEGNARVKTKFERVVMEMRGLPTGDVVVDSTKDEEADNPLAKVMAGLVRTMGKAEFTSVMTPRGEMTDLKIPDELVKQFQAMPGSGQFADFFSEKGLKNLMGHSGLVLPKDAVKDGDSWSQKVDVKMPFGKINTEMKYTYKGSETKDGKRLEKIAFVPTTNIEADANAPIAMKIEGQKGEGTIYFDPEVGRMHEMRLNQVTEMSMTVLNMNMTQKMDQTVTMKLKDR